MMYNLNIYKKSNTTVFVEINFIDKKFNMFIKDLLNIYCINKGIKPKGIYFNVKNNNILTRTFNKKPYILVHANIRRFRDNFAVFKQLLDGKEYNFSSPYIADVFIYKVGDAVNNFLYKNLKEHIFPELKFYYIWDQFKNERPFNNGMSDYINDDEIREFLNVN